MLDRWPHIKRSLRVTPSGRIEDDFRWWWGVEDKLTPTERAAANEEWADFYEWQLAQRADELAGDRVRHHLIATWTDSMAYCCRRAAAYARGEDPGEWVSQEQRRPDLATSYGTTGSASSKMAPASSAL